MEPDHTTQAAMYCRKCDYQLKGLSENRCPECGRPFDPGDPRTFFRSPHGGAWRRRGRRIAIVLCVLVLLAVTDFLLLYVPWKREQKIAHWVLHGAWVQYQPTRSRWWSHVLIGPQKLFERVESLTLNDIWFNDSDVEYLAGYTSQLHDLRLFNIRLTSKGLAALGRIHSLDRLTLCQMQVTDDDLVYLAGLKNLTRLELRLTDTTDAGLVHLKNLTHLKTLCLQTPKVAGSGLVHLAGLADLHELWLTGTAVTAQGLGYLAGLPKLERLVLGPEQLGPPAKPSHEVSSGMPGSLPEYDGALPGIPGLLPEYVDYASLTTLRRVVSLREIIVDTGYRDGSWSRGLHSVLPNVTVSEALMTP